MSDWISRKLFVHLPYGVLTEIRERVKHESCDRAALAMSIGAVVALSAAPVGTVSHCLNENHQLVRRAQQSQSTLYNPGLPPGLLYHRLGHVVLSCPYPPVSPAAHRDRS